MVTPLLLSYALSIAILRTFHQEKETIGLIYILPPGVIKIDGLVKSPSVPLGAGLRFNFVAAVYCFVRFAPQFLRALHLELFAKPSFRRLFTGASLLTVLNLGKR